MAGKKKDLPVQFCSCPNVKIMICDSCHQRFNDTDKQSLPGTVVPVGWRVKADCKACGLKYAKGKECYGCFDTRRSPDFRHFTDVGECVDDRSKDAELEDKFMSARSDRINKVVQCVALKKKKLRLLRKGTKSTKKNSSAVGSQDWRIGVQRKLLDKSLKAIVAVLRSRKQEEPMS